MKIGTLIRFNYATNKAQGKIGSIIEFSPVPLSFFCTLVRKKEENKNAYLLKILIYTVSIC